MGQPLTTVLSEAITGGREAVRFDAAVAGRLMDLAGDLAVNLVIAALLLVVTFFAARWASAATRRLLDRFRPTRRDRTVQGFIVQVVRTVVVIIGLVAVLQRLGVQSASILAVLGAASLAIGLAMQGTLSNVAAGVVLLVLRPYRVGDVIEVGGQGGVVQRLDLFVTQLSNANNHKIVVPNAKVLGDVIINVTGQQTRRIEVGFQVGYGADLERVKSLLRLVAAGHEKVLPDPAPWAGVTALLDSAVEVTLQAWTRSDDWWQTRSDLLQQVKEGLDQAGIEIPFPHQVAVPYGEDALVVAPFTAAPQKD